MYRVQAVIGLLLLMLAAPQATQMTNAGPYQFKRLDAPSILSPNFTRNLFPTADDTRAADINNRGEIVGTFHVPGESTTHGFYRSASGTFFRVDHPKGDLTVITAINDEGVIAGWYHDPADMRDHGFRATRR